MEGRRQMEEISVEANEVTEHVKAESEKIGEGKVGDIQTHDTSSSKKPKPNVKPKNTIPQPFSLATERRLSRERRVSVDFEEKKMPDIARSFNSKVLSQVWNATERISIQKLAAKSTSRTIKTTLPPKIASGDLPAEKIVKKIVPKPVTKSQVPKETEQEKPKANKKKEEGGGMESKKKTTFKAKPLPGFYLEKGPHRSSNSDIRPVRKQGKVLPKSEGNKDKPVSSTVSNIGKRTVNKLAKQHGESSTTTTRKEKIAAAGVVS